MAVVSGQGLAVAYGGQDVFSDIDFSIAHGDRIGLVGPNGEGKTSLLRVIGASQTPTAGTVVSMRGLRIGYLPQDPPPPGQRTVHEEMLAVFGHLRAQQAELRRLEQTMADPAQRDAALGRYSSLQATFEAAGGYTYEWRIEQVLSGLGFRMDELDTPLAHLSGGQRMRALLARLLLEEPDLLLLDEPTNHLDLEALEWLEGTLVTWPGSMVVVAHDRYFLDKVATRIWDLAFGRLEAYRGNYSHYVAQRAARRERQRKEYVAQQEQIAKTEDYIRRYMAGQRTRQAQGRLKRLERFQRDEAIERPREAKHIRLDLTTDVRSGNVVLRTKDLVVGYGSETPHVLFRAPDLEVLRLERVALIGPNGSGKSTFLKTVLGEVPALAGRVRVGASVQLGYLAQMHAGLDPEKSVLDTILDERNMPIGEARSLLGRFLFSGDDVFKRVGDLSGGERSRVALALLTMREPNLLLLDEPTNHLDLASQEILEDVLRDYPGTILLISHDRYLVDRLATHVWALRDGQLHAYKGGYGAYLVAREQEKAAASAVASAVLRDEDWRGRAREERRVRREQERLAEQVRVLEQEITEQEAHLASLEKELAAASAAQQVTRVEELGLAHQGAQERLQELLEAWGELASVHLADSAPA
jgi:ATP-binding cassette subfamily F protein 3